MKRIGLFLLAMLMFLSACQVTDPGEEPSIKPQIVVSTTMLGDLVKQVGQDKIDVSMLFGPGVDPHLVQPTGGDTKLIQDADLVFFSGLHLEAHFAQILSAYSDKTVQVGDGFGEDKLLYVTGDDGVAVDPHFWFSVPLWIDAASIVKEALQELDPEHAADYEQQAADYILELEELDLWIRDEIERLPEDKRVLVTAHDAFNYLADAYGLEVAAIGGMSTDSEVTTSDVNHIASLVLERDIQTIFIESSVPQTSVDAVIAEVERRGGTLVMGDELFSDAIGIGEYAEYINAVKHNITVIVEGLLNE